MQLSQIEEVSGQEGLQTGEYTAIRLGPECIVGLQENSLGQDVQELVSTTSSRQQVSIASVDHSQVYPQLHQSQRVLQTSLAHDPQLLFVVTLSQVQGAVQVGELFVFL